MLGAAYAEYESWFPPEIWPLYLEDILDLEGRAGDSELLVADLDGDIVGCVSYFGPGPKDAYPTDGVADRWPHEWGAFRLLAVDPRTRGRGVGRALTVACIDRAHADGAPAIGLHTTAPMATARAMYERMGFERAPRFDFRPGPDVLVEAYSLTLPATI